MITNHSIFSNRPAIESKFIPNNFNLDNLRTSGWYAPLKDVINGPEKFKLYHLFVIAPNPDLYITQLAFGTTYKIITPSAIDGDEQIVDDEIIRDRNNNIIYTAQRVAADINEDNVPDTDLGDFFINVGNNTYETVRFVTNDKIEDGVHPLDSDENEDDNIVEDEDVIKITNRSAIFSRSFFEGTWTQWTIWTGGYIEGTESSGESSSTETYIDTDKIYSYIDGRIHFDSKLEGVYAYGMKVEITGTYNEAPYTPDSNVYGVSASGIEYDSVNDFPDVGNPQILYIVKSENRLYRYSETDGLYYCVGSDYNEIMDIISAGVPKTNNDDATDINNDDDNTTPDNGYVYDGN